MIRPMRLSTTEMSSDASRSSSTLLTGARRPLPPLRATPRATPRAAVSGSPLQPPLLLLALLLLLLARLGLLVA